MTANKASFDFDYNSSFGDLGINIDASFSTASTSSTHIYSRSSSRVRGYNFDSFVYNEGEHVFSDKTKTILADSEMVLVTNPDGSIYLIDYIDSYRNTSGEDDFDGVDLQYKIVKEPDSTSVPTLTHEPAFDSEPTSTGKASFDFDYHNSFGDLGINIDASFSTASTDSTYIYSRSSSRVKGYNFDSFVYNEGEYIFNNKTKEILADSEMVLVTNPDGSIYLIDYIDSYRNTSGEDDFDGVDLQYKIVKELDSTLVPTPAPAPTPAPEPEPAPEHSPVPSPTPEPTLTGDPPNLITATLRGKDITLQFDNMISDTLPSNGRFTLNQSNRQYLVIDIEMRASEGIVTLTAEKELDPAAAITLSYLDFSGDQTSGVIESSTGVDLESFSGFALNNQGSQENSLTIDEGEFEGNQITLFLSAPISDAVPSRRRFKIKAANKKQKILGISTEPDDGIIVLTTKKDLGLQKSVFVSYRDLGGDQVTGVIEDLVGNDMATIQDFEIVSSGNDATAPKVSSATLDENTLSVEFDSIIRDTSISKNRFKVKVNGKKVRVLSATVEQNDSYIDLALQPKNLRRIDINSSVTLSYKDPKGDQTSKVVEDLFGNDLDSFSGYGVEIVKI